MRRAITVFLFLCVALPAYAQKATTTTKKAGTKPMDYNTCMDKLKKNGMAPFEATRRCTAMQKRS